MSDDLFSISDKVCLITGVSKGLGAHIAQTFLSRGARVMGVSRDEPQWLTAHNALNFEHIIGDVTDPDVIHRMFAHLQTAYGGVDVVVNNAGISNVQRLVDVDEGDLLKLFNLNVFAAVNVARTAAVQMRENGNGGSIINVTSVLSDASMTGLGGYSASKAALEQLTKSMAGEWARFNVRVNNLSPGWFPSDMTEEYFSKGLGQVLKARIPMGRLGDASDLDGACLLLASDASRYMTGSTILVDGGYRIIG